MSTLAERVSTGEASFSILENRVSELERARDHHRDTTIALQLHLEDVEDRSRWNKLWLRGLPETTKAENLGDKVQEIFRIILEDPTGSIDIDRAHRALGSRSADPGRPRDVVCRLLRYPQKDAILRRAWEQGEVELDGAHITILPDLSRATLRRRAMLRPVLDLAKQKGFTYRWVYPLAVTFRKDGLPTPCKHQRPPRSFPVTRIRSDSCPRLAPNTPTPCWQITLE